MTRGNAQPRGRHHVGTLAGFKSERVAGFRLECMAGFVGIRIRNDDRENLMQLDLLTALNAERAARRAAIVVTNVESGRQRLVKAGDIARDPLRAVLAEHLRTSKSGMEEMAEGRVFLTVYVPRRSSSSPAPCISARRWRRSQNSSAMT